MELILDLHTHTLASGHAYNTINEMAATAIEKDLELIAITDHSSKMPGGAHDFYFSNLAAVPCVYTDNKIGKSVELLKGVEANIICQCGEYCLDIKLSENRSKSIQIVIASLHPPCISYGTEKENTDALISIMKSGFVDIIGHPCDPRYPFDIDAVTYTAKETGVFLEINNLSLTPGTFRSGGEEQIIKMINFCHKLKHPLTIGSDAHYCDAVGDFWYAKKILDETKTDSSLILNSSVDLLKSNLRYFIQE